MASGSRVSEPVFSEPLPSRDPIGFATPHHSDDQVYNEVEVLLQSQTTTFDRSRVPDDQMITLAQLYGSRGADVCQAIESNRRIVFHAMGDTGSSDSRKYQTELTVSDLLTLDAITANSANRPAFAFHLGDIVYSFGEARFYYDQFYEPFRDYPAPILAVPGNHNSFIVPGTAPRGTPADLREKFLLP